MDKCHIHITRATFTSLLHKEVVNVELFPKLRSCKQDLGFPVIHDNWAVGPLILLVSPAHSSIGIMNFQSVETNISIFFVGGLFCFVFSSLIFLQLQPWGLVLWSCWETHWIRLIVRWGGLVETSHRQCKDRAVNATELTPGNVADSLICISQWWRPRQDKHA